MLSMKSIEMVMGSLNEVIAVRKWVTAHFNGNMCIVVEREKKIKLLISNNCYCIPGKRKNYNNNGEIFSP